MSDNRTALTATEVLANYDHSGKLFFGSEVNTPLVRMLHHEKPAVRRLAANAVGLSQTNIDATVPALVTETRKESGNRGTPIPG